MNYKRTKDSNQPYYKLRFSCNKDKREKRTLENGYIDCLIIKPNRNIVINEERSEFVMFRRKHYYYPIYPIELSKETIDMIFTYLD